jgi:RNA polymerase sigma factor (sigma-70 family)
MVTLINIEDSFDGGLRHQMRSVNSAENIANLLTGIRDADPVAWDEIIHGYSSLVSTTVRSFRLQEADALDAIQMTWLRLAENAHQVRDPQRLGGWLVTTARRECLRTLRQNKREQNLIDMAADTVSGPSVDAARHTIDAHTTGMLWKLVDELSPLRRAILRMLFADNPCPYDKVARITGIPLGGVGPTRTRALRQLRKKLERLDCPYDAGTDDKRDRSTRAAHAPMPSRTAPGPPHGQAAPAGRVGLSSIARDREMNGGDRRVRLHAKKRCQARHSSS